MANVKVQSVRKKVQVSMVICEPEERRHRSGVNSLQYDTQLDRIYSAGRDSIVRIHEHEKFLLSMEHHTDWVNDIVLCCGGRNLITASSDTTVKVWNAYKGFCMSTLRTHKDYVKALAYAKDKEQVASAGFDKSIYLWDIQTLTALTASNNTVTTSSLSGSKESIYSLAMNPSGTIVVSGSTERTIRLWDPRTCLKQYKLRGHTETVKALVVSRDGSQFISGSSDGSIKLWNIGQQRCLQTILVHSDSVWALLATDNFTHVISGGRDKKVIMTDLKNIQCSILVCTEEAPILKMCFTENQRSIWVSTSRSSISCWKLPTDRQLKENLPLKSQPTVIIPGDAAIIKATVLNDKRHVLTLDTKNNVALYDVIKAQKVEDLGAINYQNEIQNRNSEKLIFIPNWFNLDLKTGMLTIHLGQEEIDCFGAWVSTKDAGLITNNVEPDQKVNYGKILLQALFEYWRRIEISEPKLFFSLPKHIPVIMSEVGGRTLYRILVGDTGGDAEDVLLNETVPNWVIANIEENCNNKFTKIQFYLKPHSSIPANMLKQEKIKKPDRLVANDFIQCRKVAEHVLDKLRKSNTTSPIGGGGGTNGNTNGTNNVTTTTTTTTTTSGVGGGGGTSSTTGGDGDYQIQSDLIGYTVDQIQLCCADQDLDHSMDLRTVKHYMWKYPSDLVLHYKILV